MVIRVRGCTAMMFDNGHGTREGENWDKNISINVPHKSFSSVKQVKEKNIPTSFCHMTK